MGEVREGEQKASTRFSQVSSIKLSVSVPYELWRSAKAVAETDKASIVVQQALEYYIYHKPFCGVEFEESESFT